MIRKLPFIIFFLTLMLTLGACTKKGSSDITDNQTITDQGQWPRVYTDGLGREVTLERAPERIVVLHFGYTEYLMALETPPVGAAGLESAQLFKTLNQYEGMKEVADVGSVTEPNLEKILELQPDLIIAAPGIHEDALEGLEKIAVVIFKTEYGTWQETLSDYAKILGKEELAETFVDDTEKIIEQTRQELSRYEDKTFIFLRPSSKGDFWTPGLDIEKGFYHNGENGFGLSAPQAYPKEAGVLSLEAIVQMNPDYIFFQDKEDICRQQAGELESSDLWQSITAVRSGNIGYLDLSVNTGSPLAIRLASEQILASVQGEAADSTSWPRTYTDTLGRNITLEKKPEKTALVFFRNYEHLFTLNEIPFAASDVEDVYKGWAALAPYAEKYDIIDLGEMQTPNLEKLLESSPDLIIVYSGVYEKIGEQLEKIAPTIAVNNHGDDWQTPLREYGKIFAKEELAESEISRLNQLLSDNRKEFSSLSDKTFAFLAIRSEKELSVYVLNYVYDQETGLGLKAPKGYLDKNRGAISLEGLLELDPDYLFLYDDMLNTNTEDQVKALSKSEVWNALSAVQKDNVYRIDRSAFSGGPLSIEFGIETILNAIKK